LLLVEVVAELIVVTTALVEVVLEESLAER
jgi:hypothetical protein